MPQIGTKTKRNLKTKFVLVISVIKDNFWCKIWVWFIIAQTCLIWNNLVSFCKISLVGHFSCSVFAKKYQFCVRIRKWWKIWIFEIHYASYMLNIKVKFKNHIFQCFFYSDTKLVFFGKNWVRKMPHKWYFGQTNQNIQNQTSLRKFVR